ncbi:hypothetical protein EYF80_064858 [Liparis tanakae]|uniref:Uncharacterized protein n=1 Tax=Liparis tanakae TaxID=230148 RepID=A0A4Z2E8C2_9TELE|nr:hypothetical protein EYF80_064858 [Liparis tanakae]
MNAPRADGQTNGCISEKLGMMDEASHTDEVMEAAWPSSTASGAQVCRHHTRMVLSQEPAAIMLTAMSEISAAWPRSVASRRPSSVPQIFTRQSSEP